MLYQICTAWGWVINDLIFIFGWTNPLRLLNARLAVLYNLCSKLGAKTMTRACANSGVVEKFYYYFISIYTNRWYTLHINNWYAGAQISKQNCHYAFAPVITPWYTRHNMAFLHTWWDTWSKMYFTNKPNA